MRRPWVDVLDHVDLHRGRGDAGHRADRAVVVAGLEARPRPARPAPRPRPRRWPGPRRAARRSTAPRSGPDMRSHSIGGPAWSSRSSRMPGIDVARRGQAGEERPRGRHALDGGAVGLLDVHVVGHAASSSWPGFRQLLVAARRRPPVHLHRLGSLRDQAGVEGLEPDVDRGQRRPDRLERHRRSPASCLRRPPGAGQRSSTASSTRAEDPRAGPLQRLDLRARSCGSSSVPITIDRHLPRCRPPARRSARSTGASSPAGSAWAPSPSTTSSRISRDLGVGRLLAQPAQAQVAVDHRVEAADGELVGAQVEDRVPLAAQRIGQRLRDRTGRSSRRREQAAGPAGLVGQRAAGEQAAQEALPRRAKPSGARCQARLLSPRRPARPPAPPPRSGWRRMQIAQIARPGERRAEEVRPPPACPSPARAPAGGRRPRARAACDQHDHPRLRVAAEQVERLRAR